jgi:hypothetical protein
LRTRFAHQLIAGASVEQNSIGHTQIIISQDFKRIPDLYYEIFGTLPRDRSTKGDRLIRCHLIRVRLFHEIFLVFLGSPILDDDVKAVPADTTQPVVGHMTQHHASQQPVAVETPQEQAYITLLQQQQEEQMRHIRELETRLQRQQQMNQQLQHGQQPQTEGQEQGGEPPQFQLPTEVFAQIQALTGMVNQPGANPPGSYDSEQYPGGGGNYEGSNYEASNPPDQYGQGYDQQQVEYPPGGQQMTDQNYQQAFRPGYDERPQEFIAPQQVRQLIQ